MANHSNFQELAKCLSQASTICNKILGSNSSESNTSTPSSTGMASGYSSMATSRSIGEAVQRARSMIASSSQRGSYKRLNQSERLRAGSAAGGKVAKIDAKPQETRAFEFALVQGNEDGWEEPFTLNEDSTLLRGFVQLPNSATETFIRKEIAKAIQTRYSLVGENDFEFLKANRKKLIKPVNSSEYNFKQVKLLAGQGAIYVVLKDGFDCLLKNVRDEDSDNDSDGGGVIKPSTDSSEPTSIASTSMQNDLPTGESKKQPNVQNIIQDVINHCLDHDITNPVDVLRIAQSRIVTGRALEVKDPSSSDEGLTNFILVNRQEVFQSAMEELETIKDLRRTLEVSFYGETAKDLGGPRKEFFRLCLREINDKLFEKGIQEHMGEEYKSAGMVMALSILQNGNLPSFISEDILQEVFILEKPSYCIKNLREGFEKLGIYSLCSKMPILLHLFRPSPASILSRKKLVDLLKPDFSEVGSNAHKFENEAYSSFMKYIREVAAGRRMGVTLEHILQFVTGTDQEPVLGFEVEPSILFICASNECKWSFLPCAHTCTNRLELRRGHVDLKLPPEDDLFEMYDSAFSNVYFGKM